MIEDKEENNSKDQIEFERLKESLIERCKKNNITYLFDKSLFDEESLILELPNGRNKRKIGIWSLDVVKRIFDIPFEQYTFLGSYESICNYEAETIECLIEPLDRIPTHIIYRRLLNKDSFGDNVKEEELKLLIKNSNLDFEIEISPVSEHLQFFSRSRPRKAPSLKLRNIKFKQHDACLTLLEKISNSIFFQIDLLVDLPLSLSKSRILNRPFRKRKNDSLPEFKFPQSEYNEAPISLYWYARSAIRMPLLQFLAFYQSIEYFFPMYAQEEAKRKVRNILKDDSFRTESDTDIIRILKAIKLSNNNSFGDERSQLRATILECIDPDELREYLVESEDRKEFFSKATKGITKNKIPINNEELDLRNDIAERIYDIRCKIVHTKADAKESELEILLPFSKEADLLYYDIDLLQFLSRKIIIASSIPLKL